MAKRVNKNVVGLLTFVGFVVVTLTGFLVIKSLRQTDPSHYVRLAEERASNKDWDQARVYYLRAYNVAKDPSYLVQAGQTLYEKGNEIEALGMYERAVTEDPSLIEAHQRCIDIRTEIAELYATPVNWLELKKVAEKTLAADKQNAKALFTLGYALFKLSDKDGGNPRAALDNIRRAAQLAPEVVRYSTALASYAFEHDQKEEAESIVKRLVATVTTPGEDASQVRSTYAKLLSATDRLDEADRLYAEAETFAGEHPEALAAAKSLHAQFWLSRWFPIARDPQKKEEAERYYQQALALLEESIKIDEQAFLPYMILADLFAFNGQWPQALEACRKRIAIDIHREGLKAFHKKVALYRLLLQAADHSLEYARTLPAQSPEYTAAVNQAAELTDHAAGEFPDLAHGLHTLGKIKLAQGQELEALRLFERAAEKFGEPNWRNSLILARLRLQSRQPGAARTAIADALADPYADAACWITAAQIALELNEPTTAIEAADQALRRAPGNREAYRIKADAHVRLGQQELADQIYKTMESTPADLLVRAQTLQTQGNSDQALEITLHLLEKYPANVHTLRLAVYILTKKDRHSQAMALVKKALETAPEDINIKLLELVADADRSKEDRDRAQLELFHKIEDPFLRSYQLALWYAENGRPSEYSAAVEEASRQLATPGGVLDPMTRNRYQRDLIERRFTLAVAAKDWARAEAVVENAATLNADGADGLTYRGRSQMAQNKFDLALTSFKLALQVQPTNAATLTYLGQCCLAQDPPQHFEAQTYFSRAIEADPNMGVAHKGLAYIAFVQNNAQEYERKIRLCGKLLPADLWVQEQLLALQEKDSPQEGIQRRVELRQRNPNDLNNVFALADLYARTGLKEQAAECYEQLLQQNPPPLQTVAAAAEFFRKTGNTERAQQILEQNIQSADTPEKRSNATLLLVRFWYELKDYDQTDAALKRAADYALTIDVCSSYATFKNERRDYRGSLEWYGKAIDLADKTSPQLAGQLRRFRIDAYFRLSDHESARAQIDDFRRRYSDDPQGLLLVAAMQTVDGDLDGAIASLDRFLEKLPNDLNALFQRARLYVAQGRLSAAVSDLEKMRSVDPAFKTYEPRIMLADCYALTNQVHLGYEELESILRADPTAKNVAKQLINLYHDHERFADALRICTSMANRFPEDPAWVKGRGDIRLRLADASSAFADYEQAAVMSGYDPTHTAAYLAACAQTGQLDKGITFYEKNVPPDKRAPRLLIRYADLLARKGRLEEAVPQFLAAMTVIPYNDVALIRDLVLAVIDGGGKDKAPELFRTPRTDAGLERARKHLLALLLGHFDQHGESLDLMQSLLQSSQDRDEKTMLLASMGNVHERLADLGKESERRGRLEAALAVYEQLIQLDDRNVIGLNNIAFLLSDKLNRPRDAIGYAKKAFLIYDSPNVRDTLAWIHVQLDEFPQAIALLTKVLETSPRFVPGIYHLAEAYRRSGDRTKAESLLEAALNLINEGVSEDYRERVKQALADVRQ